jgi:GNAT superfamily N-acetyltransferase
MEIRTVTEAEKPQALALAERVFLTYVGPYYTQEGIDEYCNSLRDPEYVALLTIYGAFEGDTLMGILATRLEGTHIALFFVDGAYHRRGIGRRLFEKAWEADPSNRLTVNAAPYAYDIYHKLGFVDTAKEENVRGIISTPMVYELD